MKMKTKLTFAAVVAAGLMASGCSQQMAAQQAVEQSVVEVQPVEPVEPAVTEVRTVIDCSNCSKPTPQPRSSGNQWGHTHPAIPNCTESMQHTHKFNDRNHKHAYSCRKGVARPAPRPAPVYRPRINADTHTHPAIPNCTDSISHTHPNGARQHDHKYSCLRPAPRPAPVYRPKPMQHQPVPVMPKVKAKGTYRGAIPIDPKFKQRYTY